MAAVTKESLIPYDLIQKHQKHRTFNTVKPNATSKKIKEM